jgi:uroporphyrin-III C-methyltransferase
MPRAPLLDLLQSTRPPIAFLQFPVPMADTEHEAATPAAPRNAARMRAWLVGLALSLLAVAVAAVWLSEHNARRELRTEVAKHFADIDAKDQAAQSAFKDEQESLREAQAKLALLESRQAETQNQQAALEALYRELAPSRDEWALTEIEQMLQLASQQLLVVHNVPSALSALQLADSKLQRLDRPQFVPLRKAIARDMDSLKAVPFVDVPGLSLRLDQAIATIDTLPLAMEQRLPPQPATAQLTDERGWRAFLRTVWQDLRQLVRIQNVDHPEPPLLAPQEQYFLRENIKLRLLSARFALLLNDPRNFRTDLSAAGAWLRQYFDNRAPAVTSLQVMLKQMQATDMATEVPDVVRSLDAIRALKAAPERSAR